MKLSSTPNTAPIAATALRAPAAASRFTSTRYTTTHTHRQPTSNASVKIPDVGWLSAPMMRSGCDRCVTEARPPTTAITSAATAAGNAAAFARPRNSSAATHANMQPPMPVRAVNKTRDHWISMPYASFANHAASCASDAGLMASTSCHVAILSDRM